MTKRMRRSLGRPRNLVAVDDTRSPMLRLLQDCNVQGMIQVDYAQQWRTLFKAQRLGYVDDRQHLTERGAAFVARGGEDTERKRTADRIDGYDRDDLGESPDY